MIPACPRKRETRSGSTVTDLLFAATAAALVAAATAAFFGWFWYALPLLRRART